MKIKKLRHIGLRVGSAMEKSEELFKLAGFGVVERGTDTIDFVDMNWVKLQHGDVVIEISDRHIFPFHLALEVDKVPKDAYHHVAPSGCKIVFSSNPFNIEYVEPPK